MESVVYVHLHLRKQLLLRHPPAQQSHLAEESPSGVPKCCLHILL